MVLRISLSAINYHIVEKFSLVKITLYRNIFCGGKKKIINFEYNFFFLKNNSYRTILNSNLLNVEERSVI